MHNRGIEHLLNYVFNNTLKNTTIAAVTKRIIWSKRPMLFFKMKYSIVQQY